MSSLLLLCVAHHAQYTHQYLVLNPIISELFLPYVAGRSYRRSGSTAQVVRWPGRSRCLHVLTACPYCTASAGPSSIHHVFVDCPDVFACTVKGCRKSTSLLVSRPRTLAPSSLSIRHPRRFPIDRYRWIPYITPSLQYIATHSPA